MSAADMSIHGFQRIAAAVLHVHLADPRANAAATLEMARQADERGAVLVAFPELGMTGYSNDDLFHQRALLDAAVDAVAEVVAASRTLRPVLVVGMPLVIDARLFNIAVVIHRGRVLGIVPKSYLPNYREFYEKRQFAAAREALRRSVTFLGDEVPFGTDLVFEAAGIENLGIHVEICEDVWVPIPPSSWAAMAGATVLVNLSASNITIGKADYRHELAAGQSGRLIAAYLYTAAGAGESTTDLAWDGHALIYENGHLLAEGERFADDGQLVCADIDLERLATDRMRMTSYGDAIADHRDRLAQFRHVSFDPDPPGVEDARDTRGPVVLERTFERFPFVPASPERRAERCSEAFRIQIQGLTTRLSATGIERLVVGVSGGLDSTHALLVACQAMDSLGLPRRNVLGYTMPGFATSTTTKSNALQLMDALGITADEIDIRTSAQQMLEDIGHPAARGEPVYDITFENVQAGERTSHLFRLANLHDALVVGTGDLSELALGWCTYGVGDHMSHYNVNASVPKTLMQFLIRWVATTTRFEDEVNEVLLRIVETEISPELVPHADGDVDAIGQRTEELIGPYELHDFFLYYTARYGFAPTKVAYLAHHAWHERTQGRWPDLIPEAKRNEYTEEQVTTWLREFVRRFFGTSQFKRSALPNGPKIGSGGSLSPRGDWRAPSDGPATTWLAELDGP
jgi:NAD+ synthase (glutamine-hydrolysing)